MQKLTIFMAIAVLLLSGCSKSAKTTSDDNSSKDAIIKEIDPIGIGKWEVSHYTDDFGEITNKKYILLKGRGVFSNSATINSELIVGLLIDKSTFAFKLLEYGSSPANYDDEYFITEIKDSEGIIHKLYLYNTSLSSRISNYSKNDYNEIVNILKKGGNIKVLMKYKRYRYSSIEYRFSLNVDGFENAFKLLD